MSAEVKKWGGVLERGLGLGHFDGRYQSAVSAIAGAFQGFGLGWPQTAVLTFPLEFPELACTTSSISDLPRFVRFLRRGSSLGGGGKPAKTGDELLTEWDHRPPRMN